MNPLTNIKNLQKLNERELELGIIGKKSWHDEYKDSAWIFVGGLPYDLTEGDVVCVFSQYGEIVNINLVRDSKTGKSKGYAFICFENQRSTVLSVDNLNGIKILGRTIRVDHVKDYKMPKERGDEDDVTVKLRQEGCAPKIESSPEEVEKEDDKEQLKKKKKELKKKLKKKKKKKKKVSSLSEEDEDDNSNSDNDNEEESRRPVAPKLEIKEEKLDIGYDKALKHSSKTAHDQHLTSDDDDGGGSDRRGKRSRDSNQGNIRDGDQEQTWSGRDRERKYDDSAERERRGQDWNTSDRDRHRDNDYGDDNNDDDRERKGDVRDENRRYKDGRSVEMRNRDGRPRERDERDFHHIADRGRGEERGYRDDRGRDRYPDMRFEEDRNRDGYTWRGRDGGDDRNQRGDNHYRNGDGRTDRNRSGSRDRNRAPTKRYRSRSRDR